MMMPSYYYHYDALSMPPVDGSPDAEFPSTEGMEALLREVFNAYAIRPIFYFFGKNF